MADKSDTIGALADMISYFSALLALGGLFLAYQRFMKERRLGIAEYMLITFLLAGIALWLFIVLRR
ncbi:hypothetical protein [Nonomuraea fuscirosea]|uniref:hypothetical protein n=1 Tax=Nonomuraea fuscirosea TaxID=1291556 RepID=UPI0033D28018